MKFSLLVHFLACYTNRSSRKQWRTSITNDTGLGETLTHSMLLVPLDHTSNVQAETRTRGRLSFPSMHDGEDYNGDLSLRPLENGSGSGTTINFVADDICRSEKRSLRNVKLLHRRHLYEHLLQHPTSALVRRTHAVPVVTGQDHLVLTSALYLSRWQWKALSPQSSATQFLLPSINTQQNKTITIEKTCAVLPSLDIYPSAIAAWAVLLNKNSMQHLTECIYI